MDLEIVRNLFREASGRWDLFDYFNDSNEVLDDAFFINQGSKYLDINYPYSNQHRWYKKDIAVGDDKLEFEGARIIHEVWATSHSEQSRYQLERKTLEWIRTKYADLSYADTSSPCYWTESLKRLSPQQKAQTSASHDDFTYDYDDVLFNSDFEVSGILFKPPVDEVFTMSVLGDFYSGKLTVNSDTNYWSALFPDILTSAALLCLEGFYRNNSGYANAKAILDDRTRGLDHDKASQESSTNDSVMEG